MSRSFSLNQFTSVVFNASLNLQFEFVAIYVFFTRGCPKKAIIFFDFGPVLVFWTRSKVVQRGPIGTNMVNLIFLTFWDPIEPIKTTLDHFRQKWFFAQNGKSGVWRRCCRAKKQILFEMMVPKGYQLVKNTCDDYFGPFWTTLECVQNTKSGPKSNKFIVTFFWDTLYIVCCGSC